MPLAGFGGETAMRYARLRWRHDALRFMDRWSIDFSQLMPFSRKRAWQGKAISSPGMMPLNLVKSAAPRKPYSLDSLINAPKKDQRFPNPALWIFWTLLTSIRSPFNQSN